jgi:RimJ/RimL family protein N-acetyltransferase
MTEVTLRPVEDADLDAIFEQMRDPEAVRMAAFTVEDPSDRAAFDAHMRRILADPDNTNRAILVDGVLAGTVASFVIEGDTEVTYWIDRAFWGRGIATRALAELLRLVPERPVMARVAADNEASRRVLEKCGFRRVGEDEGYAAARGSVITELILTLP